MPRESSSCCKRGPPPPAPKPSGPTARSRRPGAHPADGANGAEPAPDTASAATTTVAATGRTEPLTSTWSRRALAALLIPALILLIVVLI